MSDADRHVKILLDVERDDGGHETESVWAVPEGGGYRLDNIPFYALELAYGDLVAATPDPDGLLRYVELIAASGHSTVRLWFETVNHVPNVRSDLHAMGCSTEVDLPRLVAVDVPPKVPYGQIQCYLDEQERAGILEYEEACLGQGKEDQVRP